MDSPVLFISAILVGMVAGILMVIPFWSIVRKKRDQLEDRLVNCWKAYRKVIDDLALQTAKADIAEERSSRLYNESVRLQLQVDMLKGKKGRISKSSKKPPIQ